MIRLPCACRGRTAVRLPANSSHMCCVELALKGLASAFPCHWLTAMPCWWAPVRAKRLSMAVHGCPWLPLPAWYGCAQAWGNGQAVGWCICAPCFNLLVTREKRLCTHLRSWGFMRRGFSPFINPTALPRWMAPIRAKQLSVAATALVI